MLLYPLLNIFFAHVASPGLPLPTYSRFRHIVSTAIVLLFFLNVVYPQGLSSTAAVAVPSDPSAVHDSLKVPRDSTLARSDSVVVVQPDSVARRILPTRVGTLDEGLSSQSTLTSDDINWIERTSTGDILSTLPGVYVRDQQSPGQYSGITIRGEDWRSVAFLMNGRLMNEPASGTYNLYYFSPEYIERMETVTGVRAFLFGLNATAGAVNLVTKNYLANRPFSKIYFTQGPYNYQFSDGTFAQNITRDFNLSFGFQHQGNDGRFTNSAHDAWNVRTKLRYEPTPGFDIILSEYFTSTKTEMNGGVDVGTQVTADAFGVVAPVLNNDTRERVFRHDLDLTLRAHFLGDTTNASTLTFYYSHNRREFRDEARSGASRPVVEADHISSWMGGLFTQTLANKWQALTLRGNAELRQVEGSPTIGRRRNFIGSASAQEELFLPYGFTVAGFARLDRYLKESYTGIGGDVRWRFTDNFQLCGGYSLSRRLPTYTELAWSGVAAPKRTTLAEKHRQFGFGVEWDGEHGKVSITYFQKTIENPILILTPFTTLSSSFPPISIENAGEGVKTTIGGVEGAFAIRIWRLFLEGTLLFQNEANRKSNEALLPEFSARGGVFFRDKLFQDHLDLKAGFQGRVITKHHGATFNPEVLAYAMHSGPTIGPASSLDFLMIAHIGDAYIHLLWQNLLDTKYFLTPYYPVEERSVRFGVAWEFVN